MSNSYLCYKEPLTDHQCIDTVVILHRKIICKATCIQTNILMDDDDDDVWGQVAAAAAAAAVAADDDNDWFSE